MRFKLAAGLGEPWCRDGGIPQGCPLSVVFIVALYVPWCRRLEVTPLVAPQLYADNLKCSSVCPRVLFGAAKFTVRADGQDVFPGKCVLLSTSSAVRRSMKLWDVSGNGRAWSVEWDVRDLGGHLDFTRRARDGALSRRVREATHGVGAVGALPLGFQAQLGLMRRKYLLAGLHAVEASYVSASSLAVCRAAYVRSDGPIKCPCAHPGCFEPAGCPVGVNSAFHVVWTRFRLIRRYLA